MGGGGCEPRGMGTQVRFGWVCAPRPQLFERWITLLYLVDSTIQPSKNQGQVFKFGPRFGKNFK